MSHPGFHNKIEPNGTYPPEKGRYVLYAALSCPYVHRALMIHALKGLDDVIPIIYTHPVMQPLPDGTRTWTFGGQTEGALQPGVITILDAAKALNEDDLSQTAKDFIFDIDYRNTTCAGVDVTDKITNFKTSKEIYLKSDPTFDRTTFTVPILFDTKTQTIVTNESAEILAILDHSFDEWAKYPDFTIHPASIPLADIEAAYTDAQNSFAFAAFKALSAKNQIEYMTIVESIVNYLDNLDETLSKQRFVVGNEFTEADIRLIVGLLRFDIANSVFTRVIAKPIHSYVNISAYLRDVYQNVWNDKARQYWNPRHSWLSPFFVYGETNKTGIIPITPVADYSTPKVDRSTVGQ